MLISVNEQSSRSRAGVFQQHFLWGCAYERDIRWGSGTRPQGGSGGLWPSACSETLCCEVCPSPGLALGLLGASAARSGSLLTQGGAGHRRSARQVTRERVSSAPMGETLPIHVAASRQPPRCCWGRDRHLPLWHRLLRVVMSKCPDRVPQCW